MVGVDPAQVVDVQGDHGVIDKAMEEFRKQIDVKLANTGAGVVDVVHQTGATGQVDHHP